MEKEYFEQLLDARFTHIESNQQDIKDTVNKILEQTTATNGRVRDLEKWQSGVISADKEHDKNERKLNGWAIALITFIIAILTTGATIWATKQWH